MKAVRGPAAVPTFCRQYPDGLPGYEAVTDLYVWQNGLVGDPQPAVTRVINEKDDHGLTGHLAGQGDRCLTHGPNGRARIRRQVNASMTGAIHGR